MSTRSWGGFGLKLWMGAGGCHLLACSRRLYSCPDPPGSLNPAAPEILEAGFPRGVSLQACDDA